MEGGLSATGCADVIEHHTWILAMSVERVLVNRVEQWTDMSLVADAPADAVREGRLTRPDRLHQYLSPLARAHGYTAGHGAGLTGELYHIAGLDPAG